MLAKEALRDLWYLTGSEDHFSISVWMFKGIHCSAANTLLNFSSISSPVSPSIHPPTFPLEVSYYYHLLLSDRKIIQLTGIVLHLPDHLIHHIGRCGNSNWVVMHFLHRGTMKTSLRHFSSKRQQFAWTVIQLVQHTNSFFTIKFRSLWCVSDHGFHLTAFPVLDQWLKVSSRPNGERTFRQADTQSMQN